MLLIHLMTVFLIGHRVAEAEPNPTMINRDNEAQNPLLIFATEGNPFVQEPKSVGLRRSIPPTSFGLGGFGTTGLDTFPGANLGLGAGLGTNFGATNLIGVGGLNPALTSSFSPLGLRSPVGFSPLGTNMLGGFGLGTSLYNQPTSLWMNNNLNGLAGIGGLNELTAYGGLGIGGIPGVNSYGNLAGYGGINSLNGYNNLAGIGSLNSFNGYSNLAGIGGLNGLNSVTTFGIPNGYSNFNSLSTGGFRTGFGTGIGTGFGTGIGTGIGTGFGTGFGTGYGNGLGGFSGLNGLAGQTNFGSLSNGINGFSSFNGLNRNGGTTNTFDSTNTNNRFNTLNNNFNSGQSGFNTPTQFGTNAFGEGNSFKRAPDDPTSPYYTQLFDSGNTNGFQDSQSDNGFGKKRNSADAASSSPSSRPSPVVNHSAGSQVRRHLSN